METIQKAIEVDVPVSTVYNQWTQFEDFPLFMEGTRVVRQIEPNRLHWQVNIAGNEFEWDAEIFEQRPNEIISWRSIHGAMNIGSVHFIPLQDGKTFIELTMTFKPEVITRSIGDAVRLVSQRLHGDLERFKCFIENRNQTVPSWRGQSDSMRLFAY
ncbi:MAG TPA: SRPBCC family protein [Candidatus Kapabacteria bacterium]|nr:SRPBCC family protein [Candidatus Kapabacteria bacterium]